ncbi:hypothetical protein D3C80_1813420 [compost metagenome]
MHLVADRHFQQQFGLHHLGQLTTQRTGERTGEPGDFPLVVLPIRMQEQQRQHLSPIFAE